MTHVKWNFDGQETIASDGAVIKWDDDTFFTISYNGKLPYRSLDFRHETYDTDIFQSAPVVNYPNDQPYTRITEFKYLTGQLHKKTSVVYEYPQAQGDPYYPIPKPENAEIYNKYKALADKEENVTFVGRLASYRYYNMDQVVAQALTVYARMHGIDRKAAASAARLTPSVKAVNGNGAVSRITA